MPASRIWLLSLAAILAALVVALFAYRARFSMQAARAFDVPAAAPGAPRVLIATQGSAFKDAVVDGLVSHLKARGAAVSVLDVAQLDRITATEWAAVVVLHTWEMGKPPASVARFMQRNGARPNVVDLITSGGGEARIEGVDVISAASRVADVPLRIEQLSARIDALLTPPSR